MTDTGIASIVRSLAEGVDPGRVLRDVAHEALSRTGASHLLLATMLEGQLTPLVAIGHPHTVLSDVGREAFSAGRPARRTDPRAALVALAVPVRHRGSVIAALAVAGRAAEPHLGGATLDAERLAVAADCAALALSTRPPGSVLTGISDQDGGLALAESLSSLAGAKTTDQVVTAALAVGGTRFGARAGLVCLPSGPALVVDGAGRFVAVNPAAAEPFALSDAFEIGRPAAGRLGHPELEARLLGTGPSASDGGEIEVVLGRPTPRRYRALARALGGPGGRVLVLRAAPAAPGSDRDDLDVVASLSRALRDPLAVISALAAGGPTGDGVASASEWEVARKG